MGDTGCQGGAMGGGDADDGHVNRRLEGDSSTVGGPTTTLGGLRGGNFL